MNKTAQQTGAQGTLVGENDAAEPQMSNPLDNETHFSPGQSDTPQKDSEQMTHGQEGYPGFRPEGINSLPGADPPIAGDVDSGSTESAHQQGQDGDTTKDEKKKAFNYSG
jgi:hypothetical protein